MLKGISSAACEKNVGGIAKFWISPQNNVKGLIKNDEDHKVTDVEAPDGQNWKEYEPMPETSTVTWVGVEGVGKSVAYWNYTINLVFPRQDTAKNLEVEELSKEPMAIIYEDNNGKRWLLGDVRGAKMLAATAGDYGTAYTDANQYTVQFECPMLHLAYELSADCDIYPKSESLG